MSTEHQDDIVGYVSLHDVQSNIVPWKHDIHVEPVWYHYGDVIMGAIAPQITSLTIVYSTV